MSSLANLKFIKTLGQTNKTKLTKFYQTRYGVKLSKDDIISLFRTETNYYKHLQSLYNDDIERRRDEMTELIEKEKEQKKREKEEKLKAQKEATRLRRNEKARAERAEKKMIVGTFDSRTVRDVEQRFYDFLRKQTGKVNIVVVATKTGIIDNATFNAGDVVRSDFMNFDNLGTSFSDWFEQIGKFWYFYPSNIITNFDAIIYTIKGNELSDKQISQVVKQKFRDADNGKCVFNPIRTWANEKYEIACETKNKSSKSRYNVILEKLDMLEEKYPDGVEEDNINEVCNELQIDISIDTPFQSKTFINSKSNRKALKHFRYLNTRLNHVVHNAYVKESTETINKSIDELKDIMNKLNKLHEYYTWKVSNGNVYQINTIDKVYSTPNDMMKAFNDFEFETGLSECKIDDIDDFDLSQFIRSGTHYNSTIDFRPVHDLNIEDVFHCDMKKAYSAFHQCKFYEGFLGKITDFRKCDKMQGVGIYEIVDLIIPNGKFKQYNDIMNIYANGIYPSVELKFLDSIGATYKIVAGCYGVKPIDFRFNETMLTEKDIFGNSYYALWTGKSDSHKLTKDFYMKGDVLFAHAIRQNTDNTVTHFTDDTIQVSYNKRHNYHLGHVTAFITAYQRLNVIEQLMAIDYDDVIRVCVDGIYTMNEVTNLKNVFRLKNDIEDKTFGNIAGESYISNVKYYGSYADTRPNYVKELSIGAGGNGKTHEKLTDNGFQKLLYCAPSWKLARCKANDYGCEVNVWARVISSDKSQTDLIRKNYNVLLIDECSMMSENQKKKIFELYGDMKLIFCGDLGYQLSAIEGEEMNTNGFDIITEKTKNYRCKDIRLLNLLNKLRSMVNKSSYEINSFVINELADYIISDDKLKQMYKIDDMILTPTNSLRQKYSDMFSSMEKYYCLENTREFSNGDIVIGEKPNCKCEIRHAYTVHSIQGETAKNNLFIVANNMWDSRLFYTALSRAQYLSQIKIIV